MCNYTTLNRNAIGYAVLCASCKKIHIGLKHIVFNFSFEEFDSFCTKVDRIYQHHSECETIDSTIKLPTETETINLYFKIDELKRLNNLLIGAQQKFLIQKLFEFHEN
jgi:hypothetical protein